jgi:uncharacterized membrane protein
MRSVTKSPDQDRLCRIFLVLASCFGLLLVFATPPFQVADEPNHFYRAYLLSEMKFLSEIADGSPGGMLPVSLVRTVEQVTDDVRFHPKHKVDPQKIRSSFDIPLMRKSRSFVRFPNTAMYPPTVYAPQALGIMTGRMLNPAPVTLLYLGRIFNLIFWIICIWGTLKITPAGRHLFFLIALMPMTIFQAASLSADTPTTALAFLLIAFFLRSSLREFTPGRVWILCLYGLSFLVLMSKQVYFPIVLLYLIIPRRAFRSSKAYYLNTVVYFSVCFLIVALWSVVLQTLYFPYLSTSPGIRISELVPHIPELITVLTSTIGAEMVRYIKTYVGVLGWLDTGFPILFTWYYGAAILGASLFRYKNESRFTPSHRFVMIGIVCINFLLIILTILILHIQYEKRAPDSLHVLEGVQGRYFIPFSPLLFLSLSMIEVKSAVSQRVARLVLTGITLFSLVLTLYIVIGRYYI